MGMNPHAEKSILGTRLNATIRLQAASVVFSFFRYDGFIPTRPSPWPPVFREHQNKTGFLEEIQWLFG
jgi:hypothetical protein